MKIKVLFLLLLFITIMVSCSELIEGYRLKDHQFTDEISLGEFEVLAYGNQFSIKEWWEQQPMINLEYAGEEKVFNEIKTVLQNLGFVMGKGKNIYIKTERLQNRFLYIEMIYDSKEVNNMDSLMIFSEDNTPQLEIFLKNALGDYSESLPKLILVYTDQFFQVNGEVLYKGPDYWIIKLFDEKLKITMENRTMDFNVPFYPVFFLDLTENQYMLTVEANNSQTVYIDGEKFKAPIQLNLSEGVHEIKYADQSQFIYLKTDMVFSLDKIEKAEITIHLNVPAQVRILQDGRIVESFYAKTEKVVLTPGEYQLIVEEKGYRNHEEMVTLNSSQQLSKDIVLVEIPGTILNRMKLTEEFADIYFKNRQVILTKLDESILINIENDDISRIESKVVWFDGHILVSGNKITNLESNILFTTDSLIINAVQTKDSLWLFTSDKKVISLDVNTWNLQWTRNVNFIADQIVTTDEHICILDPYSRVILINTELGYRDFFDIRIPEITEIDFLENTEEKIRIRLEGYHGYIDYYFKSRSTDLRKTDIEGQQVEFYQSGNKLYQDGQPLVSIKGSLIKVVKKQNHLAILTNEEMVVCTSF